MTSSVFQRLKGICVPLMAASRLTPAITTNTLKLLTDLLGLLRDIKASGGSLDEKLLSYTVYPVRVILSRNESPDIPDQLLEKIFLILANLCEGSMEVFILCGSVLGGVEGKGKGKVRDDETKEAAAQCLYALLRLRGEEEATLHSKSATSRMAQFQEHASSQRFIPFLGRTLDSLLSTADSQHRNLQLVSLDLLGLLIESYFPDALTPTVLPGVVSSMTKLALGRGGSLGWAKGAIVSQALKVLRIVVTRSIGDDLCIRDGAVQHVQDLEKLAELLNPSSPEPSVKPRQYFTSRTPSWLHGTASQLHIALNTLTPLVSHTNPTALHALTDFSSHILANTVLTLPQSQPLLLSFLLSLSVSDAPARQPLLQTLMYSTKDNLTSLPRLLSSQADSKVEHLAGVISATCLLAIPSDQKPGITSISTGLGTLLGPTGGIEKWGWRLLSVLELVEPSLIGSGTSTAQLVLENDDGAASEATFPELTFTNLSTRSAHEALARMFHDLGRAAGDSCLTAVEWFINVGRNGSGSHAVSAMWCACRLLEGVSGVSILFGDALPSFQRSKRLDKLARGLAKSISELWDRADDDIPEDTPAENADEDESLSVLHVKGVDRLEDSLKIMQSSNAPKTRRSNAQPTLHRILCLQVLAVVSGVLQARSAPLLLYTLYPVLHSLVSPIFYLSSTALATLNFMARSASYASPSNLLLSNFDYALDAVARRLTRRWLDVDATKVLVVLVRLVGSDVVDKASDVVEECFDRLDEFHGYEIVVEGLVEVLGEVIKVIEVEETIKRGDAPARPSSPSFNIPKDTEQLQSFFEWFPRRHDQLQPEPDVLDSPDPGQPEHVDEEPVATTTQLLTKQIVSRSLYFLTHGSAVIRARILTLLAASVPVLPDSALLPAVHSAWPFILNRLSDSETYVVAATACLMDALVTHAGSFMYRRMWNDVWPRFSTILAKLDAADSTSALSRRGWGSVGSDSAYTHSHRLYRALLRSMTATMKGVRAQDAPVWQALLAFRRFLHRQTHDELQKCAREFYVAAGVNNADAVWLALSMTLPSSQEPSMAFLRHEKWEIDENVEQIFQCIDN
ncbi:hypothetical protein C8F01DRAFT_1361891 [Mycena amicta]|nr:hypothetical protein C8F01DRAFT_1361891 [Mycena amicta]